MVCSYFFMCCVQAWRGESVSLTMPRMSSKSDGQAVGTPLPEGEATSVHAREVRNTITTNSAIAATKIKDPTIGAAMNGVPFSTTIATPAGQTEQEQQHAADQVEMRMRRSQRKILLNAYGDASEHPDQQDHSPNAHHQRSDHPSFPQDPVGIASGLASGSSRVVPVFVT
jgi:hypothetical protein